MTSLRSITAIPCCCPKCGWEGVTGDAEPDVDGDGSLGCPECYVTTADGRLVRPLLDIELNEHEKQPSTSTGQH